MSKDNDRDQRIVDFVKKFSLLGNEFIWSLDQTDLQLFFYLVQGYASQQTSELKAENTRLWEEMDRYIGVTKIALQQAGVIAAIRPLAFADHSSVEYNMEEIRKILNNVK